MNKLLVPTIQRITAISLETDKWTNPNSIYARLPEHYKKRYQEFYNTMPKPVHYKPFEKAFIVDHEFGVKFVADTHFTFCFLVFRSVGLCFLKFVFFLFTIRKRVQDVPIPALYPTQSLLGIWGGEGIVPGYIRPFQTGFKRLTYMYVYVCCN